MSNAKHHSRPKPNFISNADSQDSEYQEETHRNSHKYCDEYEKELTKNISLQKSEDEDSECQGVPLLTGQFGALIVGFFLFFEIYPHSDNCVCVGYHTRKITLPVIPLTVPVTLPIPVMSDARTGIVRPFILHSF